MAPRLESLDERSLREWITTRLEILEKAPYSDRRDGHTAELYALLGELDGLREDAVAMREP